MSENSPAVRRARFRSARTAGHARRVLPLAVLVVTGLLILLFDLNRFISFEILQTHYRLLTDFVAERPAQSVLAFVLLYAAATALSLPGGTLLTVSGGFLFGAALGTVYSVAAATIGATVVFLVAKTALGDALRARAGPAFRSMAAGFTRNAFSYLLTLRLIPIFPFFVVNLVPAFFGVPLRTYVITTFVGIMPGAFVFASAGAGIGGILDSAGTFSPGNVLTPDVLVALTGLGVLSLLPILYKRLRLR